MDKLEQLEIQKQISEMVLWLDWRHAESTATCFPIHRPDTLYINTTGTFATNQSWWEQNAVVVITHEHLHCLLCSLGRVDASRALDNLWPTTPKSWFLVDGNPEHFKWRDAKRR